MKAICVAGSPSPTAWSHRLLDAVGYVLTESGWETEFVVLKALDLPLVDIPAYHAGGLYPDPAVRSWREQVAAADAVVLATPVHHASYSGLLKSALDLLEADAFLRKPVGLLANGGAARGATIGCEHLRSVVKALGGWAVPTQIASSSQDFDPETRELTSKALLKRCRQLCAELEDLARAFRRPADPA